MQLQAKSQELDVDGEGDSGSSWRWRMMDRQPNDQVTIRLLMGPSSTASGLGPWELVPELDACLDMHKQGRGGSILAHPGR